MLTSLIVNLLSKKHHYDAECERSSRFRTVKRAHALDELTGGA